jgi:hypothetical protein
LYGFKIRELIFIPNLDQTIQETEVDKQKKLIENQRKFRNLESDRKAYAEETVANIKKKR